MYRDIAGYLHYNHAEKISFGVQRCGGARELGSMNYTMLLLISLPAIYPTNPRNTTAGKTTDVARQGISAFKSFINRSGLIHSNSRILLTELENRGSGVRSLRVRSL
jgi:hypothetical protein